jgi:hypothetical protein
MKVECWNVEKRERRGGRKGDGRKRIFQVGIPHPRVFCAKSVELLENTGVVFFEGAKECGII